MIHPFNNSCTAAQLMKKPPQALAGIACGGTGHAVHT